MNIMHTTSLLSTNLVYNAEKSKIPIKNHFNFKYLFVFFPLSKNNLFTLSYLIVTSFYNDRERDSKYTTLKSNAGTNVGVRSTVGTVSAIRAIEIVLRSTIYLVHAA